MAPEFIALAAIVAAYWVGRWAGRIDAQTRHRAEMLDDVRDAP